MFSLQARNLTYAYPQRPALFKNLSFIIESGGSYWIKGANGSGKSTLLNLLSGVKPLQSGQLISTIDGSKDENLSRSFLAAERCGLDLRLSATENIYLFHQLRNQYLPKEDCHHILSKWGFMSTFLRKNFPVSCFSTGMKRRLSLARIESLSCKLWILDEPSLGLDIEAVELLSFAIVEQQKRGGAVIFSSHDMSFAKNVKTVEIDL